MMMNSNDPLTLAVAHVDKHKLVTAVGVAPGAWNTLTRWDAEALAIYSSVLGNISKWILGDLLVWVERDVAHKLGVSTGRKFWDERDKAWAQLMAHCQVHHEQTTLLHMTRTARLFAHNERRPLLSFEHHRLVASHPDREVWLDMAEAGNWTSKRLSQELTATMEEGYDPTLPHVFEGIANKVRDVCGAMEIYLERVSPREVSLSKGENAIVLEARVVDGLPVIRVKV